MTSVDWLSRVADALNHLDKEFARNELAYLALTSKVEKQIIDRLAFSLHRDFGCHGNISVAREFTVPREIQRVDLAITHGRAPRLLLEAKAMQSFNVNLPKRSRKYRARIEEDIKKLKKYSPVTSPTSLDKVVLHLTTHTSVSPDTKWNGIVKYSSRIRNHRPKNIGEMKEKLNEQLPKNKFPIRASGEIPGGCAFNVNVIIHFRLFGPY